MSIDLSATYIYKRAIAATQLAPYKALKLDHVIEELASALDLVHSSGFFQEYTRHGPEHSKALVESMDWLITEEQRDDLTHADYLFLLLSCLLHDLGMLTSPQEFDGRNKDVMAKFVSRLTSDAGGRSFLALIPQGFKYREELIFEEFVRHNHPRRVALAITGEEDATVGEIGKLTKTLKGLFAPLAAKARSDLALICESHHSSDLYDTAKYSTKSVHGQDPQAQVNVLAVCLLLRAADVLQIGTGRTPSVQFSLISPSNPISYLHWMKEMGVSRVYRDIVPANVELAQPAQHRIQIFGYFDEAEPFFALMNHVKYATIELQKCVSWSNSAADASSYRFKWSQIDTQKVETKGFEREQFSFQIDREKILNLLIGHTLYNDPRVVLRELVQNSIDAVRLYNYSNNADGGVIKAALDTQERVLSITDNGTGMTSDTIRKHLLTVGSSFYSTDEFARDFPKFAPISRFGIGILTSFMIADEIEILTSHPSEATARRITINGPSGTYLIKLLDKSAIQGQFNGDDHGTRIRLTVRPNSRKIDLVAELAHWFGFPGCKLLANEDAGGEVSIGYDHPADILAEALKEYLSRYQDSGKWYTYQVIRQDGDNMQAAYVMRTSTYSGRSYLAQQQDFFRRGTEEAELFAAAGTYLQGIRVESGSPGFRSEGPLAIVNGVGLGAPRTNVARSGIEQGEERTKLLQSVYGMYIKALMPSEGDNESVLSVTRAGRAAAGSLRLLSGLQALDADVLQSTLDDEATIVVESDGARRIISRTEFVGFEEFDTIDSRFYRIAEDLIEHIPVSKSLHDLESALELGGTPLRSKILLTSPSLHLDLREMQSLTLSRLNVSTSPRRMIATWRRVKEADPTEMLLLTQKRRQPSLAATPIIVVNEEALDASVEWAPNDYIVTSWCVLIHPAMPLVDHLRRVFGETETPGESRHLRQAVMGAVLEFLTRDRFRNNRSIDDLSRDYAQNNVEVTAEAVRIQLQPYGALQRIELEEDYFF